jgi:RNA-directed DNA polymerase
VKQIIAKLNPVVRGWGNYFRTGTCSREFLKMDQFLYSRLLRWLNRRGGQRAMRRRIWTREQLWDMGLYPMDGILEGRASTNRPEPKAQAIQDELQFSGIHPT